MSAAAKLLVERRGGVVRLVLNRPDAANAIDADLAKALLDAAVLCDEDASVRCVVLAARGKLFCAGGDIRVFASAGSALGPMLEGLAGDLHLAMQRLARMGKPLITAIQGPAGGAGLSLAMLGDIALAARSAHFTMAYTALGLSPDGGSTWLLPRLIGLRRAQELALTNRRVGAEEAAALGIVTRAVDDDALAGEVDAVAATLAKSATAALGRTRHLLLSSYGASLEDQMAAEARAIAAGGASPEGQEGVQAFLAKRKPTWAEEARE